MPSRAPAVSTYKKHDTEYLFLYLNDLRTETSKILKLVQGDAGDRGGDGGNSGVEKGVGGQGWGVSSWG